MSAPIFYTWNVFGMDRGPQNAKRNARLMPGDGWGKSWHHGNIHPTEISRLRVFNQGR